MKRELEIRDVVVFESAPKRQLIDVSADGDSDTTTKDYKFKILLPNGTSVGLTIRRNPDFKMHIRDFLAYIREEYARAKQKMPSWSQKPQIRWKNNEFYLEDTTNDKKIRDEVAMAQDVMEAQEGEAVQDP